MVLYGITCESTYSCWNIVRWLGLHFASDKISSFEKMLREIRACIPGAMIMHKWIGVTANLFQMKSVHLNSLQHRSSLTLFSNIKKPCFHLLQQVHIHPKGLDSTKYTQANQIPNVIALAVACGITFGVQIVIIMKASRSDQFQVTQICQPENQSISNECSPTFNWFTLVVSIHSMIKVHLNPIHRYGCDNLQLRASDGIHVCVRMYYVLYLKDTLCANTSNVNHTCK